MSPASQFIYFVIYAAVMTGLFCFVFLMRQRRRTSRFPLGDDVRAMRRAGEQLDRDLAVLNERFEIQCLLLLALPLVGLGLPLWITQPFSASRHLGVVAACLALALAGLILMIRKMLATLEEIRNKRLALFGERVVADHLADLSAKGYAVFHDVPCLGGGGPFNLDHVVVGRGAVGVVETKTYRKRAGVNGKDYEVSYDGQKLVWPDGTSTRELDQVNGNAEWLRQELKKHLNLDVPVCAALTMPGWYVKGAPPQAPVLVENTKRLPNFIRERFQGGLTKEQEDLVCRHLRSLCMNVEYAAL
jgi:hypothetical protein